MKIKMNVKKLRNLLTASILTISLTSCGNPSKTPKSGDIHYNSNEHKLIEIDRDFDFPFGKNGLYGLEAPDGYRVIDFDYDFLKNYVSYSDYYYENNTEVTTDDENNFGKPIRKIEKDDNLYEIGEHSIISIDRNLTFIGNLSSKKDIEAPDGYEVVDYDYDVSDIFDFENITYQNNTLVEVNDFDNFGTPVTPVNKLKKDNKEFYDVGEHIIVYLNRDINPFLGKNESKTIEAPEGYEIIDYDYDKLPSTEYETILYKNIVPVTKVKNNFGKPLKETKEKDEAIVEINRDLNLLIGKTTIEKAPEKEGYYLIDYDYDRTNSFEFETCVYKKIK